MYCVLSAYLWEILGVPLGTFGHAFLACFFVQSNTNLSTYVDSEVSLGVKHVDVYTRTPYLHVLQNMVEGLCWGRNDDQCQSLLVSESTENGLELLLLFNLHQGNVILACCEKALVKKKRASDKTNSECAIVTIVFWKGLGGLPH